MLSFSGISVWAEAVWPPPSAFPERKAAKELCAKLRFAAHPQAFPLGGRCPSAHTGADEGPIIERFFVGPDALIGPLGGSFRWGVSPPVGGEVLSQRWGKYPKDRRGRGRWTTAPPRSIGPLSPDPLYEGRVPVRSCNSFGAQNLSGFLPSLPLHWGLAWLKISNGAISYPRLALPNKRAWFKTQTPHPPPSGAPSPKGEGFEIQAFCLPL